MVSLIKEGLFLCIWREKEMIEIIRKQAYNLDNYSPIHYYNERK